MYVWYVMCECMYVCIDGWMDGWMDVRDVCNVWMYVCMDGWMDGRKCGMHRPKV